jgi:MoaA/NifB/PqqE/SkfB family radical SAM enzyme
VKNWQYLSLLRFGLSTVLFRRKDPILGTIILTDACNLHCRHCAVNNVKQRYLSVGEVRAEMRRYYDAGVHILFFCGGETFLWQDGDLGLRDMVREAKTMGFYLVNVVTNGTLGLGLPEADVVFLSLDGMREAHNQIRGDTFDTIMANLEKAKDSNVCVYMAINKINLADIEDLAQLVKDHPALRSISFNFHTPYEGTEYLELSPEEKAQALERIKALKERGYPIFNLTKAFPIYLRNQWKRPCHQCLVSEEGRWYVCGRCSEIPGLCQKCGYLFAVEFSELFRGNIPLILEMFATYRRYA